MKKCAKCGLKPELIEKYCRFENGRRTCYKRDILPTLKHFDKTTYTVENGGLNIEFREGSNGQRVKYWGN